MFTTTPRTDPAPTDTNYTFDVGVFLVRVLHDGTATVEFDGTTVARCDDELAAQRDAGARMMARQAKLANLQAAA